MFVRLREKNDCQHVELASRLNERGSSVRLTPIVGSLDAVRELMTSAVHARKRKIGFLQDD